mmetsp:Transcript_16479/g.27910  ORF Transcript_16479/g.27910 Transcript_16479/m.27910 type:complete len:453 (-) Transcript_16479:166-1524(-)
MHLVTDFIFLQLLCLQRCNAQVQSHIHKLVEGNSAIGISVKFVKECLHSIFVHCLVPLSKLFGWSCLNLLTCKDLGRSFLGHSGLQVLCHPLHELLGGEAAGTHEITGAVTGAESLVDGFAAAEGELCHFRLRFWMKSCSVVHCTQQCHNHAQGIHGCFLTTKVHVPQIGYSSMGGFKFLDQGAILALAHQVRGDKARAAMHLRHLVGQHVTIVVVACHSKAATRPADDLHCSGITDQVDQLASTLVKKPSLQKLLLVLCIENLLHLLPEALLPLENGLFRHHIRHNVGLKAALEKDVRQVLDIVQGVVIHDNCRFIIMKYSPVNDHRLFLLIFRPVSCEHLSFADSLPACTILTANCMSLKEDGALESKLNAWDVDGVTRDCNTIPAPSHGAVGRAERLLEAKLLHLFCGWSNGWLLEDGTQTFARGHSIVQDLVIRIIATVAAEIEVFPL